MAKADRKGRSKGGEKHVRLHRWMLRSAAWKHLSHAGRSLLIELHDLYNGENNGEIFLSVRDAAARLGVGKNTAQRLFYELEAFGFIRPRQRGSFSLKVRHATSWILTEFSFANQVPTRDFMRWQPDGEIQNTVPQRGTDSTHQRDRDALTVPTRGTDSPPERDREGHFDPAHGPRERDTDSIPGEGDQPEHALDPDPERAAPKPTEDDLLEIPDGYVMSGSQFEALCSASGHSPLSFFRRLGFDGRSVRRLLKSPKIDFAEDNFARSMIDQMRAEAAAPRAETVDADERKLQNRATF